MGLVLLRKPSPISFSLCQIFSTLVAPNDFIGTRITIAAEELDLVMIVSDCAENCI